MQALRCVILRHGTHRFINQLSLRNSSTQAALHHELTSRGPNITYDYLSPSQSHLLNLSLADFLPPSCYPPNFTGSNHVLPLARHNISHFSPRYILPQGHHLVYFSRQVSDNALLPDGTDPLQSPGPPFVRQMWAGGSLLFNTSEEYQPELHSTRAACIERISNVSVKGLEGDEKVFVSIERRIGLVESAWNVNEREVDNEELLQRFGARDDDVLGDCSLIETRNIVFMRKKSEAVAKEDVARAERTLKSTKSPDFSVSIVPNKTLLFRFSALTFNAHAIHLDPEYCRKVEGQRDLLVHGPLLLVLMISVLRSQLKHGEMIEKFEYRNLAPLYANEELKVCVKKDRERDARFDVWIDGPGGLRVKGSAIISKLPSYHETYGSVPPHE